MGDMIEMKVTPTLNNKGKEPIHFKDRMSLSNEDPTI